MWSRAVLGLLLVLTASACATEEPAMPRTCTDTDAAGYERALGAAPAAVRLPGGVRISDCLRRVRDDGELQTLGLVLHPVAERLAARARAGAAGAAVALGYLGAAAATGAQRSNGISAELARRIATTATGIEGRLGAALRRGEAAGRVTG